MESAPILDYNDVKLTRRKITDMISQTLRDARRYEETMERKIGR